MPTHYYDLFRDILETLDPWFTPEQRENANIALNAGEPDVALWDAGPALKYADPVWRERIATAVMNRMSEDDSLFEEINEYYGSYAKREPTEQDLT